MVSFLEARLMSVEPHLEGGGEVSLVNSSQGSKYLAIVICGRA